MQEPPWVWKEPGMTMTNNDDEMLKLQLDYSWKAYTPSIGQSLTAQLT